MPSKRASVLAWARTLALGLAPGASLAQTEADESVAEGAHRDRVGAEIIAVEKQRGESEIAPLWLILRLRQQRTGRAVLTNVQVLKAATDNAEIQSLAALTQVKAKSILVEISLFIRVHPPDFNLGRAD